MEPHPQPSPDSTNNDRVRNGSDVTPSEHIDQPLASLAPANPLDWQPVAQTTTPLDELKTYAREMNAGYRTLADSIGRAKQLFNSLHITVEADRSREAYPQFVTLNKIPNLNGIDPYRVIFPGDPYLDERRHFFAVITVSLPNQLTSPGDAAPAGVKAGLAEAGEKPRIPRDQAVIAWLEYDGAHDCYTVRRPNPRGLGDYSEFRFTDLEPHQKLLDDRWAWNGLERALQSVLPEGLLAEDRHHGGLREILNDAINIRSVDSSHPLPRPYEMAAYLLDAIAEVNVTRGGFLWSKEIARPARPPATEIVDQAEQFATIHKSREAHSQMSALKELGSHLLGLQASWSTVACVGELVARLEEEMTKGTPPSRLARDLKKILGWPSKQIKGPACVGDFLKAVDDMKRTADVGGRVGGEECKVALESLNRGLRALAAAA